MSPKRKPLNPDQITRRERKRRKEIRRLNQEQHLLERVDPQKILKTKESRKDPDHNALG